MVAIEYGWPRRLSTVVDYDGRMQSMWSQSYFRDDGMEYEKTLQEAKRLIKGKDYDKAGEILANMLSYYHAEGYRFDPPGGPGARAEKLWSSIVRKCSKNAKISWNRNDDAG